MNSLTTTWCPTHSGVHCAAQLTPASCTIWLLRCNVLHTCRFVTMYDVNTTAKVFVYGLFLAEVAAFSILCLAGDSERAQQMVLGLVGSRYVGWATLLINPAVCMSCCLQASALLLLRLDP